MKKIALLFLSFFVLFSCKEKVQEKQKIVLKINKDVKLSSGTLYQVDKFPSKYIAARNVSVWVPENYTKDKKYAVLYMHDGQMLFDATTTWNKQEWEVDEVASSLIKKGAVKDFIVVGVWNISKTRWNDYFPEKAFQFLTKAEQNKMLAEAKKNNFSVDLNADEYLKYLTQEIKPYIDANFSTLSNRENTFVGGSSMGGLISMYAMLEYPNVFSAAACLSTHWVGASPKDNNPLPDAIFKYIASKNIDVSNHKFYFDFGTETLDKYYGQYEEKVNQLFTDKGFTTENFKNLKFEGAAHDEISWAKRLEIPFTFLLKK